MISNKLFYRSSSKLLKYKKKLLVSIITPSYNSDKHLEKSILSVFNQSYTNIEYLIIDGKSVDKTIDIIEKHKKKIDVFVSEKDKGAYDAINKGIELSKGDIIFYLGTGDLLKKKSIEKYINTYNSLSNKNVVINSYIEKINDNGKAIGVWTNKYKIIKGYDAFNHSTWFVPKSIFKKFGLYSTEYKICSDYEYYLKLKENNIDFITIKEPLMSFRVGGISSNYQTLKERLNISLLYTNIFEAYIDFIKRLIIKILSKLNNLLR